MITDIYAGKKLGQATLATLIIAIILVLTVLSTINPVLAAPDDGIPGIIDKNPGSVVTIDGIEWVIVKNQYMSASMKTATLLILNDVLYPNTGGVVYAISQAEYGAGNWLNNRVQQQMDGWYTALNSPTLKQWALKPVLGGSPNASWVNNLSPIPLAGNVTNAIAFLPRVADLFPSLSTSQLILFNPQTPSSALKEWWTGTISSVGAGIGHLEILKTSGAWSNTPFDGGVLLGYPTYKYARPAIWVVSSSQPVSASPFATLSFNANSGVGAPPGQTVNRNTYAIISPQIPTHASATFLGWGLSSTATTPTYQAGDYVFMDSDKTLYAVWSSGGGAADDNTGILGLREKTPGSVISIDGLEWVVIKSQYMSASMRTIYLLLLNDVLYPNTGGVLYAISQAEYGSGNWTNNRVQQLMDGWYAALNAPTLKKWALKPMLGSSPYETWVNNVSPLPFAGSAFYQIAYLPRKADLFPAVSTSQLILFNPQNPASTLKEWWTSTIAQVGSGNGCLEILRTSGAWSYTPFDGGVLLGYPTYKYARPAIWVVGSNSSAPPAPITATINVVHKDANSGAILGQGTYPVNAGYYGPYDAGSFVGYGPGVLAPGSAPGSGTIAPGQTITITYLYTAIPQPKIDISIAVVWDDFNNITNRRPAAITVGLFRNGVAFKMQTVASVTVGNNQTVVFSDLEKHDAAGNEYNYTAVEQPINSYVTAINKYTILNSIIR